VALLVASAGCSPQTISPDVSDVETLEAAIDAALLANDASALAPFLAEDAVRVGPSGRVSTKPQWLEQIAGGQIRYLSVTRCDVRMRRYDGVAVVDGLVDITVQRPSSDPEPEHNRYLRVYVLDEGGWRLAAHQATAAPVGVTCEATSAFASPGDHSAH
jgi:ketosteroid isomerase-like protein